MKSRLHLVVSMLLAVMAGELLVACESKNGSGSHATPVAGQPGQPGQPPVPKNPDGTSDSGGGTGVDNKVFESYIVDPTTLPAYREHVAPLFANLQSADGKKKNAHASIVKMKTWYIAPVELDRVGKDALGVVFLKSDTQQLARQTMKEIWIDKRIFDRMDKKDQGELILHEMVMNFYLLKYVKMSELCLHSEMLSPKEKNDSETQDSKNNEQDKNNQGCEKYAAYLDQMMPPEKPAPLSETDNENIRYATGWLLKHAHEPIPEIDFIKVLHAKGFDKRIFSPENYRDQKDRENQEKKIARKELLSILRAAQLTDNMPELCVGLKTDQSKPCRIEFSETEKQWGAAKLPFITVTARIEGEAPIELSFVAGDELSISRNADYEGGHAYMLAMATLQESPVLGMRSHFGFLVFREENSLIGRGQLTLTAVTITPGIITAIDKSGQFGCETRPPRLRTFVDQPIVALRADRANEKSARFFASIPPLVYCAK